MSEETSFERDVKAGSGEGFGGGGYTEPTTQEMIDEISDSLDRIKEYTGNFYKHIPDDIQAVHSLTKQGGDEAERFVGLLLYEYEHREDAIGQMIYDLGCSISFMENNLKGTDSKKENSN